MIKKFEINNKFDIEAMQKQVKDMRNLLNKLANGEIPDENNYTLSDLKNFCKSLIENQRNDLSKIAPGSWCVVPTKIVGEIMPSDARVDFLFFPTYIAVAILTRVLIDYPEITKGISNYKKALQEGLKFSTYRQLKGHGFGAIGEMIEAIKILSLGKVPLYLNLYPDFSPDMYQLLKKIKKRLVKALKHGETIGYWNEDYTQDYKEVVEILKDF